MARSSIYALALIAFIVSVAFHMPGVDADDALHNQRSLNLTEAVTGDTNGDILSLLPESGQFQDESELGGPVDPIIPLDELDPLPTGTIENLDNTLADSDDSAPETGNVVNLDPSSLPGLTSDEDGNLVSILADDSGLVGLEEPMISLDELDPLPTAPIENFEKTLAGSDDSAPETGIVDDFDPSSLPGWTSDDNGNLVPELVDDSGLAGPAEPMISLDELGLLPTGTIENLDNTLADSDDSAPETGNVVNLDPSSLPGLTSDEDGNLVSILADDSGLVGLEEPMISLDELGLLPTGTFENFDDTVANSDDPVLPDIFYF